MDWQTGKAAGCRTLGKRRRPAEPAGCLSALWIPAPRSAVKTAAGMLRLSEKRVFPFPAAQAWPAGSVPSRSPACEPPVSRHRRGARGQARWGHRRSAAREWLAEAALPAMASARSTERAKAAPTAHRAVGTAFQNLASAGSQAPCLRPPSGRQSSCTRRKCCRSGAYAPGCSGPWRAREPCAWPRGKSAW